MGWRTWGAEAGSALRPMDGGGGKAPAGAGDVEGSPLKAVLVKGPAHGKLDLKEDGGFVYTPDLNFNGADSFEYRASDGELASAAATVTISVAPGERRAWVGPGPGPRIALPPQPRRWAAVPPRPGASDAQEVRCLKATTGSQ